MLDHIETEQQANDAFYKQLFNVFDSDKLGYITVENFVNIFKQNIAEQHDNYEHKLNQVVDSLDPNGLGRIDYSQFVNGMTKLLYNDDINNNQEIRSRRATFTFENSDNLEQTVDLLRLNYKHLNESYEDDDDIDPIEKSNYESSTNNNTLEEIFENLNEDESTHNSPTNKSSSNETDNYDFLDEINNSDSETKTANEADEASDMFGIDSNMISNHRKSLTSSSSSTNLKRQQFLQKKRFSLSFSAFEDVEDEARSRIINDELSKYESIVQNLEKQIINLTNENESLKSEINEQLNRNKCLNQENSCLIEKLQGAEEHLFDFERRHHCLIEDEKQKQQELMKKIYSTHNEEQIQLTSQIKSLETHVNKLKQEHSVQLKQIQDLNKLIEIKENLINKEEDKVKKLTQDILELNSNMNYLEIENANQIAQYDKQIKQLLNEQDEIQIELNTKENILLNMQNNNLVVQNEFNLKSKCELFEKENQQLKNEIENLNSNLEILNAQIYKNNLDDNSSLFLNFNRMQDRKESVTKNESSLATEINTMSKEEILNKLVQEQQLSARLKDYIDDLVPKIIEYCPKIFEIKTVTKRK